MTKFQYEQEPEAPAQISADLLARMKQAEQALEKDKAAPDGLEVDISTDSVDFDAVLKSVSSGHRSDPLPEAFVGTTGEGVPGEGPRDRNLSSIIGMIRDEGPAGGPEDQELAEDVLELRSEERPAPGAPPKEASAPQREHPGAMQPGGTRGNPFLNILVIFLLLAVAGLAFLTYQQIQRQDRLEARVKAAQQVVSLLDERYRALEERSSAAPVMPDLVRRSELQQALEKQQRQFANELLFFTAVLATPVAADEKAQQGQKSATETGVALPGPVEVAEVSSKNIDAPAKREAAAKKRAKPAKSVVTGTDRGDWVVYLRSFSHRGKAEKALAGYIGKVPAMAVLEGRVKGKPVYRLAVTGFASKKEALAYRAEARRKLGFKGAWIARN